MKLIINKFPPITEKCEIDLSKKLTLFVGKNNSGKTYISQLIWAINNIDIVNYLINDSKELISFIDKEDIKLTETLIDKISSNFTNIVKKDIKKIFKQQLDIDIEIKFEKSNLINKTIEANINIAHGRLELTKNENSDCINVSYTTEDISDIDNTNKTTYVNNYIEYIIVKSMLSSNTIYMPSTRLFLPSFYKYIFSIEKEFKDTIISNFDELNNQNKSFFQSSYTEPVYRLIKKLIFELDKPLEQNRYLDKLVNLIEGDITVDKLEELGMADISYIPKNGSKLPMYLSSSMVNQLTTVYLYFKYWYRGNNDFLLLDEPEMNLHPEKKIEFMKILLDYASKNKLLLATHSSTMAKSIINYSLLFALKDKEQNKDKIKAFIEENELKMDYDINLKSSDIAIYYFNGNTIIAYKNSDESLFHFGTFTEIEELQVKQQEYLLNELEDDA